MTKEELNKYKKVDLIEHIMRLHNTKKWLEDKLEDKTLEAEELESENKVHKITIANIENHFIKLSGYRLAKGQRPIQLVFTEEYGLTDTTPRKVGDRELEYNSNKLLNGEENE